jgi:NarL family two-component system response regulator LiaR
MWLDTAQAIGRTARGEATLHPRVASRLVFEMHGAPKAKVNPFTELTERELEVLKLIAGGLTNSKIAEQLIISQNTVKGHVSNILSELHLAGRTEAAVYAWKEGIVRRENVD